MTYVHITTNELTIIESYFHQGKSVSNAARLVKRCRQTIYNLFCFFKQGNTALDYFTRYKANKKRCGRRKIILPIEQQEYIQEKVQQGWTPDVIVGRSERKINCSSRTLYRRFKDNTFDVNFLPLKGKRKPNGHQERRGKQAFKRNLRDRAKAHPDFETEFGHLEGDTIVGAHHQSAVITLVERVSKVIITLKPEGQKAIDIEKTVSSWLKKGPRNLFKSITFDCGKEFSNWKNICNTCDVNIYFADPGTPSQRGLNEHSNGLLRKDGLPKKMDFNQVDQTFVSAVASNRNHIPRKSLKYKTPLEVFLKCAKNAILSNLI